MYTRYKRLRKQCAHAKTVYTCTIQCFCRQVVNTLVSRRVCSTLIAALEACFTNWRAALAWHLCSFGSHYHGINSDSICNFSAVEAFIGSDSYWLTRRTLQRSTLPWHYHRSLLVQPQSQQLGSRNSNKYRCHTARVLH